MSSGDYEQYLRELHVLLEELDEPLLQLRVGLTCSPVDYSRVMFNLGLISGITSKIYARNAEIERGEA